MNANAPNLLDPGKPDANALRGPMRYKWQLLLVFSAALLILYWIAVPQAEKNVTIPLRIQGLSPGLVLADPLPKGVELVVQGAPRILDRLGELKLEYVLDLSQVSPGQQQIAVARKHIALPTGLSLKTLLTPHLLVMVDRAAEKQLPVVVALDGETAAGFTVTAALAQPPTVRVRGPLGKVSDLEKLMTKPINLDGHTESFKKEIALDAIEGLEVISPEAVVTAHIQIDAKIVTQTFRHVPVTARGTAYQVSITPPSITVAVKGPINALTKLLDADGINVYVDLTGLAPGVYVRRASIALPVKTTLEGVDPELFTIRLTRP
jgi:hypothetical protein